MEKVIVIVKRSAFPLNTTTHIKIGDVPIFSMASGQLKEVELPSEGFYDIAVESSWISVNKHIEFRKGINKLNIQYVLPEVYFMISAFVIIPISILSVIGVIKPVVSGVATLLFFMPIIYFTFFKRKEYFKISIDYDNYNGMSKL